MEIKSTKGLHSSQVKAIVYGDSGNGKTSLLGTLPESKTLIISAESGLLCLDDKDISVAEINTWPDLISVATMLVKGELPQFDYVCIDSLTELSDMLVKHLESSPEFKDPKMALKMWGEFSKRMTKVIKGFRDLQGKHVIFTALSEDVLDNGTVTKKPYIKGSAVQKMLNSYFDEVFYLGIEDGTGERILQTQPTSSISAKDRSGKLKPIEEPNLNNIINKIKGI